MFEVLKLQKLYCASCNSVSVSRLKSSCFVTISKPDCSYRKAFQLICYIFFFACFNLLLSEWVRLHWVGSLCFMVEVLCDSCFKRFLVFNWMTKWTSHSATFLESLLLSKLCLSCRQKLRSSNIYLHFWAVLIGCKTN